MRGNFYAKTHSLARRQAVYAHIAPCYNEGCNNERLPVRRILWVLVLAVLLAGFVFLSRALADWHYVLSGNAGDLLYVTTFDDFNQDWTQYEGRLSSEATDGVLRISVDEPVAGPYSVAAPHVGDFDMRVQARAVEGPENNGFGIVFREQDPDNFYYFEISSDGYYQVSRMLNGESRELSTWIETPYVNRGIDAVNTLRVVGRGGRFQFYVNGQQLLLCIPSDPNAVSTWNFLQAVCVDGSMLDTLADDHFPTGRLGVVATTIVGSDTGVVVDFDNVLVYAPEFES
jgi:hypothetical protein